MAYKIVTFYVGCLLAWFIVLPVFFLGSLLALLAYAVLSTAAEFLARTPEAMNHSSARETARRVCLGN